MPVHGTSVKSKVNSLFHSDQPTGDACTGHFGIRSKQIDLWWMTLAPENPHQAKVNVLLLFG